MCSPKINPIASWEYKLFLKSSFQEFLMSGNISGLFLDFGNSAEMRNLLSQCVLFFFFFSVSNFQGPLKANWLGYMDHDWQWQEGCDQRSFPLQLISIVCFGSFFSLTQSNQPLIKFWLCGSVLDGCCVTFSTTKSLKYKRFPSSSYVPGPVLPCGLHRMWLRIP